ncbi:MAG TPA: hypothetical protein VLH09_13345 [Bryobacteraceae bacterium]|nr:hypothetical protein [Bryobacteraceae bacterium]
MTLVGALALFAAGILPLWEVRAKGVQAVQVGAWPAPSGITLAADLFSALMVTLAGLMGAAAQMLDPSGYIEAVLGAGR